MIKVEIKPDTNPVPVGKKGAMQQKAWFHFHDRNTGKPEEYPTAFNIWCPRHDQTTTPYPIGVYTINASAIYLGTQQVGERRYPAILVNASDLKPLDDAK